MKFFKHSFWNLLNLLIPSLTTFIIISILGRVLTTEDFGLYSYISRILSSSSYVLISISTFAFSFYFQKLEKQKISEIYYTIIYTLSIVSSIILLLFLIFSKFIAPIDIDSIKIFNLGIGLIILFTLKGIFSEALNALFEFKKRVQLETVRSLIWLFLIIYLYIQNKLNLINVFLIIYFVYLVNIVHFYTVLKLRIKQIRISIYEAFLIFKYIFGKTKYFIITTLINFFLTILTFFCLSRFWGIESLGIFSYSFYVSFLFAMVANALSNTLLPYTSRSNLNEVSKYLWGSISILLYLYLPFILVFSFFSEKVMDILFSRDFISTEEKCSFVLILFAFFLKAVAGNMGSVINGLGETKINFQIAWKTLLFQLGIGVILIYRWSFLGGAIALFGVYLVQLTLATFYLLKNGLFIQLYSPFNLIKGLNKL